MVFLGIVSEDPGVYANQLKAEGKFHAYSTYKAKLCQ